METKRKRAKITEGGLTLIVDWAIGRSDVPRTILAIELQNVLEKMGEDVPEIEVLEKKISWYRNHAEEGPEEKPWSMATLKDHPIQPEAIPAVLNVWKFRVAREENFTIREAKWAARLSALITDPRNLSRFASRYARLELIYQLIGRPFNSIGLDKNLMGIPSIITGEDDLLPFLTLREDAIDLIQEYLKQGKRDEWGMRDLISRKLPGPNLTEEQILERGEQLVERAEAILRRWEDYKKEAHQ